MIVVKNINNNVSLCVDSHGQEVVVFGKGVGFAKPPQEIPLSKIERTFYDVNEQYLALLSDIPSEVIDFTAQQAIEIQGHLPYETSSNLVLTLADHLAFAMERAKRGIYVPMPSIYEMETSYPLEIKVGRRIVSAMERKFKCKFPSGEIQGVAMHFINARTNSTTLQAKADVALEQRYQEILEQTTQIIEWEMNLRVRRDTFNYARFATHVKYLLKRLIEKKHIDSSNLLLYDTVRREYKEVAACVDRIGEYYETDLSFPLNEEEQLYLIMHINRVCSGEIEQSES